MGEKKEAKLKEFIVDFGSLYIDARSRDHAREIACQMLSDNEATQIDTIVEA